MAFSRQGQAAVAVMAAAGATRGAGAVTCSDCRPRKATTLSNVPSYPPWATCSLFLRGHPRCHLWRSPTVPTFGPYCHTLWE